MRNEAAPIIVSSARPQRVSRECLMGWPLGTALLTVTCLVTVPAGAEAGQLAIHGSGDAAKWPAASRVCLVVSARATHAWVDVRTMKEEVARIWQSNGVDVIYPTSRGDTCTVTTQSTALLVLVDRPSELPRRLIGSLSSRALGSTVNSHGVPTALVLAFAERAVAAVHEIRACSAAQSSCVSRLLGRVVAHELGHVLLKTSEHGSEGLMRPMFGMEDALAAPGDAYLLTADERNRVARHLMERGRRPAHTEVASAR
jgi:hypothetical protein